MKEIDAELKINEQVEKIEKSEKKHKKRDSKVVLAVKEWMNSYGKILGYSIVIAILVAVSAVSLAIRQAEKKIGSGVMMTISDVVSKNPAFDGEQFMVSGITYEDMTTSNYETDQLAQLERAEKQIDEILSAKRQDKKEQAALEALSASHTVVTDPGNVDEPVVVATAPTTTTGESTAAAPSVAPSTTPTASTQVVADENGNYQYLGDFRLTAYCPCPICCGKYSNMENPITASGRPAVQGWTIAADRRYAFGTKMMINGQIYSVEDRGGAVTGNHFDIYFNNHAEALAFGSKVVPVYMVIE